jgi:hypothetical protein
MNKSIIGSVLLLFMCQCLCLAQNSKAFQLKVGAAKVDITPKDQPTPPATGKYDHERGYMRAIVLDNGVTRACLVSAERSIDTLTEMITDYLNNPVKK